MKKNIIGIIILTIICEVGATVGGISSPVVIDGKLDDQAWRTVEFQSGFSMLSRTRSVKDPAATRFKILADTKNIYVGIICYDPLAAKLLEISKGNLWSEDALELYFLPTGDVDEYYQFVGTVSGLRYSMFYGEKGAIMPDTYLPLWESKVSVNKDSWTLEAKIPLKAFYMTRNSRWQKNWKLNIARKRKTVYELSSWSPLKNGFQEPDSFKSFGPFPLRNIAEDVYLSNAESIIKEKKDKAYRGDLKIKAELGAPVAGEFLLTAAPANGRPVTVKVSLAKGENKLIVPDVDFPVGGTVPTTLILRDLNTNEVLAERIYPVKVSFKPLELVLTGPVYKKAIFPGQKCDRIAGTVRCALPKEQLPGVNIRVSASGGGMAKQFVNYSDAATVLPFSFDCTGLKEGERATIMAECFVNGKNIFSTDVAVRRLPPAAVKPELRIEDNRLLADNVPYFQRTVYAKYYQGGHAFRKRFDSEDQALHIDHGLTLEPARLLPKSAAEATRDIKPGEKMLAEVRKRVMARKADNFRFYYLSDEPECRQISPVYLKHIYDLVSELDPYHPVMIISRTPGRYIDCADLLLTHPYIGPLDDGKHGRFLTLPVDRVRNYIREVANSGRTDKVAGFTNQLFSYNMINANAKYPTWEELECCSWSAIVNGARALRPYAYMNLGDRPQLYANFRYFNTSVRALEKWLLSNNKHNVSATSPAQMIDLLCVEEDGTTLLIVVNTENQIRNITVSGEHLKKLKNLMEFRGDRILPVKDGKIELKLPPYHCEILTSRKIDEGLTSRAAVIAGMQAEEKARNNTGSLLLDKGMSLEVDSSTPSGWALDQKSRLFDGVRDVLVWGSRKSKREEWYELNFPKASPEFRSLRIWGHGIDGATVQIWKRGEWQKLVPVQVNKEKYMLEFKYNNPLRSVKIRINFPASSNPRTVELYELELLK